MIALIDNCFYTPNTQVTIKLQCDSDVFEDKIGRVSTEYLPSAGEILDILGIGQAPGSF